MYVAGGVDGDDDDGRVVGPSFCFDGTEVDSLNAPRTILSAGPGSSHDLPIAKESRVEGR